MLFYASNARCIPEQSFELFIESFKVKRVESCKFLGVYLDEKMTWKTHIEQITSKMSKKLVYFLELNTFYLNIYYIHCITL